jgi:hypothetical protein
MVYFNLNLTSSESTFEYSFSQEFLDKNYEVGLVKLDGLIEINQKISINCMNNKFYYLISGTDPNNNPINEEKIITIPNGKYDFNELISIINGLLKTDKSFFKASLEDGKVAIEVTKSAYSIDFSKRNTISNIFGFDNKVLTKGKHVSDYKYNSKAIDHIFVWCNLIDESYINNKKISTIYKFKLNSKEINVEPKQIIYHKVSSRPSKIILRLVDSNNNLIEFDSVNLFIELNMKELKI